MRPTRTITAAEIKRMRRSFYKDLEKYYLYPAVKTKWDKKRIEEVIEKIEKYNRNPDASEGGSYYYHTYYKIEEVDGKKILVSKKRSRRRATRIVPSEEYFDVIWDAHLRTKHGGRDKMFIYMKHRVYIPRNITVLFTKHCIVCSDRYRRKNTALLKSEATSTNYRRGFLDVIDMTEKPDESYKFIMYYQDQQTAFSCLRALPDDVTSSITSELLKIFLDMGCPEILHTIEDRELTENIVQGLKEVWSDCTILIGKNSKPDDYDASQIKNSVLRWMNEKGSSSWSRGVHFVQFEMNCNFKKRVKQTPYKAMFGVPPKFGMDTSNMPTETINSIESEEDLRTWRAQFETKLKSNSKPPENNVYAIKEEMRSDDLEQLENDDKWCWVCGLQYETSVLCRSCYCSIHEACGQYWDDTRKTIDCNLCLNNTDQDSDDGKVKIKLELEENSEPEENLELQEPDIRERIKFERDTEITGDI